MNPTVSALFADRDSGDRDAAFAALHTLFELTNQPVGWAYDVWDRLAEQATSGDNHQRSFAAQMLCRLALSDPDMRIAETMPVIERVMRDPMFVTARHVTCSVWRIGRAGEHQRRLALDALTKRYRDCGDHKNARLIRADIIESLGALHTATGDDDVKGRSGELIAGEDPAVAVKLRAAWREGAKA